MTNELLYVLPAVGCQDGLGQYRCRTKLRFTGFLEWVGLGHARWRLRGASPFFYLRGP